MSFAAATGLKNSMIGCVRLVGIEKVVILYRQHKGHYVVYNLSERL